MNSAEATRKVTPVPRISQTEALRAVRQTEALRAVRKMCAVVPHHLGKGGPLRASRCIPPGSWRIHGVEPCRASEPYRRFITRRDAFALPVPPST